MRAQSVWHLHFGEWLLLCLFIHSSLRRVHLPQLSSPLLSSPWSLHDFVSASQLILQLSAPISLLRRWIPWSPTPLISKNPTGYHICGYYCSYIIYIFIYLSSPLACKCHKGMIVSVLFTHCLSNALGEALCLSVIPCWMREEWRNEELVLRGSVGFGGRQSGSHKRQGQQQEGTDAWHLWDTLGEPVG